jgi:putative DNA primase/helicase
MKAAAWCGLLAEHARRIYGIAIRQETTQARTILQKIKKGKLKGQFTARDIYRNQWTGLQTSEECQKPLQLLTDYGYLRPLSVSTTDKGGKPTIAYIVHPSLLENATEEQP